MIDEVFIITCNGALMNKRLVLLGISKEEKIKKPFLFFNNGDVVKFRKNRLGIVEYISYNDNKISFNIKMDQDCYLFDWEYAKGIILQSYNSEIVIKFSIGIYSVSGYVNRIDGNLLSIQVLINEDTIKEEDTSVGDKINIGDKVKIEGKLIGEINSANNHGFEFIIKNLDSEIGKWIRRLVVSYYNSGKVLSVEINNKVFSCMVNDTRTLLKRNYVIMDIVGGIR